MRKIALVLASCLLAGGASAAERYLFTELSAGRSHMKPETEATSGVFNGVAVSNARFKLKYDDPTAYGFEIGGSDFAGTPLRAGLFFVTAKANLREASGSGTLTQGSRVWNLQETVTAAELRSVGLDFDNRVNLYGVTAYYDFNRDASVKPFVGVALGQADFENARDRKFAAGLHLGLNLDLSKNTYLGVRLSTYRVNGPTDKIGLRYEDLTLTNVGLQLGFRSF